MGNYREIKHVIRNYFEALEKIEPGKEAEVLGQYMSRDYRFRGSYPFRELDGAAAVAKTFWTPLKKSFTRMQRRQDIFIAGSNEFADETWVMSMGNFMGLFDAPWLGIRPTGKIVNLRYAEFNCVEEGKITKTGLFIDIIGLMEQAGTNPLPPSTGVYYNYPGPRDHDGLHFEDAPEEEGEITLALVKRMIQDLADLNDSGSMTCPPELLRKTWSDDMLWYGPAGVGATYTIPRYQRQHQLPFRGNMGDKKFVGHVCRFAEGDFGCFFGWPNLSNTPLGGWLGLPGSKINAEMQVVDVYNRKGNKLLENWVLIDIPWWLKQQGLDVLDRSESIFRPDFIKEK
jgi:hypothetical protein